jgi:LysR family transcriptional regulator, transcriptional activator of nhaA
MSEMDWLNYHHLYYFWVVAREGSIAKACEELRLAQPTISGQLRVLEDMLGGKLFARAGRGLVLTEVGQVVFRYAEEIFSLGKEMTEVVQGRQLGRPLRLVVGVTEVLPKLVAYRLLEPALRGPDPVRLICWEGKLDGLLAELAVHRLDVVLADAPMPSILRVRAYSHLLVESGISLFASPQKAAKYRRHFPKSINAAPFLLPTDNTVLRRSLEQWFENEGIRPTNAGEFEDSALLKAFGQAGCGIFAVPTLIEAEVRVQYRVQLIGRVPSIRERFYAISMERKLQHPAVVAISEAVKHIQATKK